jgi:hypothetical protein
MSENASWLLELLHSADEPADIEAIEELLREQEQEQAPAQQHLHRDLTSREVGEALGISFRTVERYFHSGCPRHSVEAVQQWRAENIKGEDGNEARPLHAAKAAAELKEREEAWRARKLRNDILEGKVLYLDDVQRDVTIAAGEVRKALQGFGAQCANLAPTEMKVAIKELIDEQARMLLTQLATRLADYRRKARHDDDNPAADNA